MHIKYREEDLYTQNRDRTRFIRVHIEYRDIQEEDLYTQKAETKKKG